MKLALGIWLLFAAQLGAGGLEKYEHLVQCDAERSRGGIRVTYLGVNGYQLEAAGHALLIDPYFSRLGLGALALNQRVAPDEARLGAGLAKVRRKVDAVLVTHAHIDHLLDVPEIMRRTGARLYAGPTAINQAVSLKLPRAQCRDVADGRARTIGPWTIRAFPAEHDRLLGFVPVTGNRLERGGPPPERANDWALGEPLSFVIEAVGKRIYVVSGGVPGALPPALKVDLAILGVALPDARRSFAAAVRQLQPTFVLPSHQDDFFRPFADGFHFAKLSDFPRVLQIHEREKLPGELILLDYFDPWTLR